MVPLAPDAMAFCASVGATRYKLSVTPDCCFCQLLPTSVVRRIRPCSPEIQPFTRSGANRILSRSSQLKGEVFASCVRVQLLPSSSDVKSTREAPTTHHLADGRLGTP